MFVAVVVALTFAAARVWWLSAIVPGQDYPQFLVFVRVLQDYTDPSSPFHGTYTVASWIIPTSLPVNLTSLLSYLCGHGAHSIEIAGKLLLTMQNVGLVAATLHLLRLLGRNRWTVLLLFPVIHPQWTVVGGFLAWATSLPLIVLAWALVVRWLSKRDLRSGAALALGLCAILLWHGIAFVQAGIGFAILWALWRAPSPGARARAVIPTIPSLVQCAVWVGPTFAARASSQGKPPEWVSAWDASEKIFQYLWATVPHYPVRALALFLIVGVGLSMSTTTIGASGPALGMWRIKNPFLVLSLAYLASFYAFPMYVGNVEGVASRFPYAALLAFLFAWNLPRALPARFVVLVAVGGFAVWCLEDITARFRAFDDDTRGASELIDQIGLHETLYYSPAGQGASKDFDGPSNKPMRELEQYATIRHGSLPNSSFAGYGYTYVRYVDGRNPMPGLFGTSYGPQITMFDYVLTRAGESMDKRFRLVAQAKGWELYGVCGSKRFPTCT
jgi:hypothetical protein